MIKTALFRLIVALVFVSLSVQAGDAPQIETAFSPDGNSEALVVKVIQSAKKTIRLSAYSRHN